MRIFKLIWLETGFLKKTVILIGLILTAFVAALLSLVSVLLDVPEGMYAGLDEYYSHFTISVRGVDADFPDGLGGTPAYGHINGITRYAVITGTDGLTLRTNPPTTDDSEGANGELLVSSLSTGYVVFPESVALLDDYAAALGEKSRFPQAPGEITINRSIAALVGVTHIGETITLSPDFEYDETDVDFPEIEPQKFTVVGFIDSSKISDVITRNPLGYLIPATYFYVMTAEEHTMSSLCFTLPDSRTQNSVYNELQRAGYEIVSRKPDQPIQNISLAQAFFGAVSLVVGVMVLFILYSLFAIFYRQRKSQICRLKLLGARNGTVAGIYCTIALALVVVAVTLGAAFSMLFNIYFIHLCASLFNIFSNNFVSHFRPSIPLGLLLVLAVFTLVLFFHFNRKVKNATIAQEVRHE